MTRAFNIEGLVRLQNYMGGKTQARTNIGAAEDPNTSGSPSSTLEEPPVVDEEPIP